MMNRRIDTTSREARVISLKILSARLGSALCCFLLLWPWPVAADCGGVADSIHRIKGYAGEAVASGRQVRVEGVVTAAFPGREGINGFWIQHGPREDARLPAGIFVYVPEPDDRLDALIRPGQRLRFEARIGVFRGQQQLTRLRDVRDCGEAGLPRPVVLQLPPDTPLARLEGLKVRFPQTLTVSGTHQLARYGSLVLSADGRLFRPTNFAGGDAAANRGRRIILDDGSYHSWPSPLPWLDEQGTRRVGSTIEDLIGVLAWAFDNYRIHPLRPPQFTEANPRPPPPPGPAGGAVRLAAFNLENYFISLGQRGARSRAGLEQQRARLVSALKALDADIVGLVEVENNPAAVADLLEYLNRDLPAEGRYRHLKGPQGTGDDAIKVSLIYRPARVQALGPLQRDKAGAHLRPPAVGRFRGAAKTGVDSWPGAFAVAVVHSKSKIRCPPAGDIDLGQGCWNRLRTGQSSALLEFSDELDEPLLVLGDINAYGGEDPVAVFTSAGFVDLIADRVPRERRYTYVFNGESGYLDHLLAPAELATRVQQAGIWHINADEPWFLAYDGRYPEAARGTVFRGSDHDPVWLDLCLRSDGDCRASHESL